MANDEEYEIMPHRTIKKIKKELEALKEKSKSKQEINSPDFKKSIDNLTESMNSLMDIFKEASEEMKIEGRTEENVQTQIGPLVEKVNEIEEENKRIAQGIVVIADMVKELKQDIQRRQMPARQQRIMSPAPIAREPHLMHAPDLSVRRAPPIQRKIPPIPGPILQRPAPAMTGGPISRPHPLERKRIPMPKPFPVQGGFPEMPAPPEPEPKKKKGLFGLFKK